MTWSILSACFLLGVGSNLAGVWVLWNRTKALFFMGSNLAGVRVLWSRTKALFFMGSKSHVRHSFGVFFAWHAWGQVLMTPKHIQTQPVFRYKLRNPCGNTVLMPKASTVHKSRIQGSAAWAVALNPGAGPHGRWPVPLPEAFGW